LILRVIFSNLRIVSRKPGDRVFSLPKCHSNEMSDFTVLALENMNTDIAWNGSIVRNSALIQKLSVRLCLICLHPPMPHSHNHKCLLSLLYVLLNEQAFH
jgi:hypothetical protein